MFVKSFFFSIRLFFHGHWLFTGQQGKGQGHLLFHCTTSTTSKSFIFYLQLCMWDDYHLSFSTSLVFTRLLRTFKHLFAFLHARWLWHIDDVMLLFVCLLDDLILQSVSWYFETFRCFTKSFFHHKSNDGRLLLISMVYTSFRAT